MEHAILHETIDGQRVDFYPETGFDDVMQTDGDDEITLRMVLEGMDAAIALLQNGLAAKANAADVYTKADLYTKTETNNLLSGKADKAATLAGYGITDGYTKTQTDNLLDNKANKATTLAGYGIANAYTKTEADSLLGAKADKTDTYTKTEVDNSLANYLPLSGGEMNGGITTSSDTPLRKNTDDSFIQINGATSYSKGAYIRINGKDEPTQSGQIRLVASDGVNVKGFFCYPNGNLKWDSKEVERVSASGTNYIRYESGLQICWGSISVPANNTSGTTAKTVTYPQAFKTATYIATNTTGTQYNLNTWTSNTQFYYTTATNTTAFTITYIAIGLWK